MNLRNIGRNFSRQLFKKLGSLTNSKLRPTILVVMALSLASGAQAQDLVGQPLHTYLGKNLGNHTGAEYNVRLGEDLGYGHLHSINIQQDQLWGIQVVAKEDSFPVRLGEKSIRFEVREGFCDPEDCAHGAARHLIDSYNDGDPLDKDVWYSFSFYIPEDFETNPEVNTSLFQFFGYGGNILHIRYRSPPQFNSGIVLTQRILPKTETILVPSEDARGRWIDVLIRTRHSYSENGSLTIWFNGEKVHDYFGRTIAGEDRNRPGPYSKFGLLNFTEGTDEYLDGKNLPNLNAFFDEFRFGRNCQDLRLSELGYDCDDFSYKGADRDDVRTLQSALNSLGCDVGAVDGIIGNKTVSAALACRRFPADVLPETLSAATVAKFADAYATEASQGNLGQEWVEIHKSESKFERGNDYQTFLVRGASKNVNFGFYLIGLFDNAGDSERLSILFEDPLTQEEVSASTQCSNAEERIWRDGTSHLILKLEKRFGGDNWTVVDFPCLARAIPSTLLDELNYVIEHLSAISLAVQTEGYVGDHHEGLELFLNNVLSGATKILADQTPVVSDALIITDANLRNSGSDGTNRSLNIKARYGDVRMNFLVAGKFSETGQSPWLAIVFRDGMSTTEAEAVDKCAATKTYDWGDGLMHLDLTMGRNGDNWVHYDADCLESLSPSFISKQIVFLRKGFRAIAEQLVETGYGGANDVGVNKFLERAASAEIEVLLR